jgi:CBS domain-containing protein
VIPPFPDGAPPKGNGKPLARPDPAALAPPAVARLDTFPYRHRVRELMSQPLIGAPREASLAAACRQMRAAKISSLVVFDAAGRAAGILTERDAVQAIAASGAAALEESIGAWMSGPVHTVPADAFAYVALGRMSRLDLRHLVAVDGGGHGVGMVTQRAMLRLRAGQALALGDQIAAAQGPGDLAPVKAALPSLAGQLLAEGVGGPGVAAVIASVVRDLTARAAELAQRDMVETGQGGAPAPWCVLVLGSGGRGESLLAADQDNAIIHAGTAADDPWFAEMGRRMTDILAAAGVPLCKGGVMARNPEWRHTREGWRQQVDQWISRKEGESLLNIDIFFDLQPVHGDFALAEDLRAYALRAAAGAPLFLRLLAADLERMRAPIGFFGQIRVKNGRFDIKMGGLFPLVTAARVLAIRNRVAALSTAERLAALVAHNALGAADAERLGGAHRLLTEIHLEQQIADFGAGHPPGNLVDPRRLPSARRRLLKQALQDAELAAAVVQSNLSG